VAAHLRDRCRSGVDISANQIAPLFGIELGGNAGRIHEIAEHHCDVAALAGGFLSRRRCRGRRRGRGRGGVEFADRAQQLAAIAENDAEIFEVLIGQVAKDGEVNAVFRKAQGILGEAELLEPVRNLLHCGLHPARTGLGRKGPE
jgi:hypothetical protein